MWRRAFPLLTLSQCEKWGVEADLIRFSVGLEETAKLVETFERALNAIPKPGPQQ